jgi:NAD(P)-dependent dehydrogenase (short-subunit alcohol dehydrogenase family)
MSSHGRIAIVTGAGRGIGKATALAFLADGYRVALVGRHRETLERTAAESGASERTLVVPADVADPDAVDALFAAVRTELGRLDVLFNNAGSGSRPAPIDEIAFDDWRKVVDVNLTGTFLCTRAAFRMMKTQDPRGGRIINNGSISAHAPRPGSAPYTATKHAITGLTKSTALDGRPHDIACGQIDIGNALTEMTARMSQGVPQADGSVRPEPAIDVTHVANAVLQMANLPLDVNVQFMTIMATKMPFVGRG